MIQREVARRICAKPGTGDYGAFTVFVNWFAQPELLFDVQPGCFIPQPKVTSSVIRLTRRSEPPAEVKKRGDVYARRKGCICSAAQDFAERFKCRIWRNE